MTGWRTTMARWSIVLALAAGLVAMHSLVLADGGVGHGSHSVPAEMSVTGPRPVPAAISVTGAHSDPAAMSVSGDPEPVERSGHHGDGMSALLHLCLAVLGMLLLGLVAPLLLAVLGRPAGSADPAAGRSSPCPRPRAPPPTSVRLAELCVSRR
jgi:hypothetical protein